MKIVYVSRTTWNLLERFNFSRVHSLMCHLNWQWGVGPSSHVPTIVEMRVTAASLIEGVLLRNKHGYSVTSGGFRAMQRAGIVELTFELESAWQGLPKQEPVELRVM